MKTPRKHAELIKAWADGAEIEWQPHPGQWEIVSIPTWSPNNTYRIKPEPKPDVLRYVRVVVSDLGCMKFIEADVNPPNLRLTFDGETLKLKAADVLK